MLYLILAGILAAIVGGAWISGDRHGVAAQEKKDAPIIATAAANLATAEAANKTLQADLAGIRGAVAACSASVKAIQDAQVGITPAVRSALAASEKRRVALDEDLARRAANAATARTPDEQCAAATKTLGDLSDYMHDVPPGAVSVPLAPAPVIAPAPPPAAAKPQSTPSQPLPSAIRRPQK